MDPALAGCVILDDRMRYFSWQELKNMTSQLSQNTRKLVDDYFSGKIKGN